MTNSLSYVPYLTGGPDRGSRVDVMGGLDPARYPQAVRDGAPRSVDFRFRSAKRGSGAC